MQRRQQYGDVMNKGKAKRENNIGGKNNRRSRRLLLTSLFQDSSYFENISHIHCAHGTYFCSAPQVTATTPHGWPSQASQ